MVVSRSRGMQECEKINDSDIDCVLRQFNHGFMITVYSTIYCMEHTSDFILLIYYVCS